MSVYSDEPRITAVLHFKSAASPRQFRLPTVRLDCRLELLFPPFAVFSQKQQQRGFTLPFPRQPPSLSRDWRLELQQLPHSSRVSGQNRKLQRRLARCIDATVHHWCAKMSGQRIQGTLGNGAENAPETHRVGCAAEHSDQWGNVKRGQK